MKGDKQLHSDAQPEYSRGTNANSKNSTGNQSGTQRQAAPPKPVAPSTGSRTSEKRPERPANNRPRPLMRKSMAKRITSSYMRMFSSWSQLIFVIMMVGWMGLNGYLHYDQFARVQEGVSELSVSQDSEESLRMVIPLSPQRFAFVVAEADGGIWMSQLPEDASVQRLLISGQLRLGPVPATAMLSGRHLWVAFSVPVVEADGQRVDLRYGVDVTVVAAQTILLFGGASLLFMLAMGLMHIQGRLTTRRALRMIDELTAKISAISSQNLNLRLNVRDATDELVELAVTFNRMMERLERAYGKQARFVSDASHELRTPIAVIQGYARMLERWGKNDPAILDESIAAIGKESRNMQDLVEKLLFIARNDRDSLVLVREPFELSKLMAEMCKDTSMLETGHKVVCEAAPDIWVIGDRNRIKQALRVFVDNALKFTDKDGTITLRLQESNGMAEASVADTGIGIPAVELPNVFDRFFRVDSARERNTGGHGLGLSIARIIVLRHGGKITVASKAGVGTRFTVKLPLLTQQKLSATTVSKNG